MSLSSIEKKHKNMSLLSSDIGGLNLIVFRSLWWRECWRVEATILLRQNRITTPFSQIRPISKTDVFCSERMHEHNVAQITVYIKKCGLRPESIHIVWSDHHNLNTFSWYFLRLLERKSRSMSRFRFLDPFIYTHLDFKKCTKLCLKQTRYQINEDT